MHLDVFLCICNNNKMLYFLDGKSVEFVNKTRLHADDFEVVKVIGRGAFGEVQLVSFTNTDLVRF